MIIIEFYGTTVTIIQKYFEKHLIYSIKFIKH
jgi:hypothetical protein